MISFIFGNKHSYKDFGIIIATRPSIPSPKRRVSYVSIPGRNSSLKFDEETYEDITIVVECTIKSVNNLSDRIDEIKGWLFNSGEGELILSLQPDKKYIAQVVNAIDFKQIYDKIGKFPIVFNCKPFKYLSTNNRITITKPETIIENIGTIYSEPIIIIYGTGEALLGINDNKIKIIDIQNQIILDSVIQDCYNDKKTNMNSNMEGEFPFLKVGFNNIKWTGNISKIELIPNWRWV